MDRKVQILSAAADLLQRRGFTSFSYQDLSDQLGITKATIHHHFPNKEDLGVALTTLFRERQAAMLANIDATCSRPSDRLEAFWERTARSCSEGDKICAVGALHCEHNVLPERVARGIGMTLDLTRRWLERVLADGRELGELDFPGSPHDQATLIAAALQGALQQSRAEGPEWWDRVIVQLRVTLGLRQPVTW